MTLKPKLCTESRDKKTCKFKNCNNRLDSPNLLCENLNYKSEGVNCA